jgi:hypothetical protein
MNPKENPTLFRLHGAAVALISFGLLACVITKDNAVSAGIGSVIFVLYCIICVTFSYGWKQKK